MSRTSVACLAFANPEAVSLDLVAKVVRWALEALVQLYLLSLEVLRLELQLREVLKDWQ